MEEGGYYLRFVKERPDPIRHLITLQESEERPVYLVPQVIFYSKKPLRSHPTLTDIFFGTQENPGYLRRMVALFKKPASVFAEVSEPINLKEVLERPDFADLGLEEKALRIRQCLLAYINRHYQSTTGPVLKTHEELKEEILTGKRLRDFTEKFAKRKKVPLYKIRKEADGYIDEIAAKYNQYMIQIFSIILKGIIRLMFDGISINKDKLNQIKSMSRKGPLVLVPCHKSHIDYLVMSYVMYHNNMPCPLIAAGKNLSFWPMGPIFRSGGAFFIRRTFKGANLYVKVFSEVHPKIASGGLSYRVLY